jgi:hypothetical protein
VGGFAICPVYPRCCTSARTPSFQAPKSDRPLRIEICETEGKGGNVFGDEDDKGTEEVGRTFIKGWIGEDKGMETIGGEMG